MRAYVALCAFASAAGALACTPTPLPPGAQGMDLCYGIAEWNEPTLNGRRLEQTFDFYRVPTSAPAPLVIWAHPNGSSKYLSPDRDLFKALVLPALASGFSFASIEFRHPVTNEAEVDSPTNPGVPHRDIARAIQFIRANAKALGIDKRNVFLVGGSRGTLTLWTALQDDMAIPDSSDPVARQSTRVNAVFGVNAQTTYDGVEFADRFLVPADRPVAKAAWRLEHPKYAQFGSAILSVNAGAKPDPPVMLRYDHPFVRRLITLQELEGMVEVHYPDFGLALCAAYLEAFGTSSRCSADADPRYTYAAGAYAGYIAFFKAYLYRPQPPSLPAQRVASPIATKPSNARRGRAAVGNDSRSRR
ncbi:MAG: hypothetical protein KA144_12125 [Xanthomonadaceae bacterium]|nr:hypothetical protein [Xanthomonadaceae bacterium]